MYSDANKATYGDCNNIKRIKPSEVINEEISKAIGSNFRILPTYEKSLLDYVYEKHYSLKTNELLKCRWQQYKNHIDKRIFSPFKFPDVRDLHFSSCDIRILPNESIHRRPDHRMKLKPGPGVDFQGQMPIPVELLMRRGTVDESVKRKKNRKGTK